MSKVRVAFVVLALFATGAAACGGTRSTGSKGLEVPKLPPVNPQALRDFDAGLRALKLGGPEANEKAATRFRSAIDLDKNLWEGWHNLGSVLLAEGDSDGAAKAFSACIKINPVHGPAVAGRAEAYRSSGDVKKASKDYRRLIELSPNTISTYARYASLLRGAGDYEDGLDVLRDALRVAGSSAEVYVELGLIYVGQGRDELAKLVLEKAVALDAKQPSVFNALALVAIGEGNDQLAFSYFDKATELDPKYVDARFNKAGVLLDSGDYEGAQVELETIKKFSPDDMDAQVSLGIAYRGLGKHPRARRTWENVVKKAPRHGVARADALFNLAILEMDFVMDDKKALAALDRYLQSSSKKHVKHQEAVELRKELGQ